MRSLSSRRIKFAPRLHAHAKSIALIWDQHELFKFLHQRTGRGSEQPSPGGQQTRSSSASEAQRWPESGTNDPQLQLVCIAAEHQAPGVCGEELVADATNQRPLADESLLATDCPPVQSAASRLQCGRLALGLEWPSAIVQCTGFCGCSCSSCGLGGGCDLGAAPTNLGRAQVLHGSAWAAPAGTGAGFSGRAATGFAIIAAAAASRVAHQSASDIGAGRPVAIAPSRTSPAADFQLAHVHFGCCCQSPAAAASPAASAAASHDQCRSARSDGNAPIGFNEPARLLAATERDCALHASKPIQEPRNHGRQSPRKSLEDYPNSRQRLAAQ